MWHTIFLTLRSEFSDLTDPADLTRLVTRMLLAVILAALLGYERERRGSAAGLRTHMMVGLGVVLVVVACEQYGMDSDDMSRVIQGLFAGMGFLGAGAILKKSQKDEVSGLTTAASLWATAAIATAAGLGRESTAIISAVLAVLILSRLMHAERRGASSDL